MPNKIPLPAINGATTAQKIEQIKSYLTQTAGLLNWLFDSLSAPTAGEDITSLFARLQPLIAQSAPIARGLGKHLAGTFLPAENLEIYYLKADKKGKITLKSRFSAFLETGQESQTFFLFGTLGGAPVHETWVLKQTGQLMGAEGFQPQTNGVGEITLTATAQDSLLIFATKED